MATIWPYFIKCERPNGRYSKCRVCGFELRGHLAGNARKHLVRRHANEVPIHLLVSADGRQGRLTDDISELCAQKEAFLHEIDVLAGSPLGMVHKARASEILITRAPRCDRFEADRHRRHNAEATRRWRKRLAEKRRLQSEVDGLERLRGSILGQRSCAGKTDTVKSCQDRGRIASNSVALEVSEDLSQLMLTVHLQLLILLSELFSLAQREKSFAVVLDCERPTEYIALGRHKPTNSLNYVYGSIESVLCDSGLARTVVVRFFDGLSGLFKPSVHAPCGAGDSDMLASGVPVVRTSRNGHVNYRFMGTQSANVSFDKLLMTVLSLLERPCQQQSHLHRRTSPPTQTLRFITTRCVARPLDPHAHLDWYRRFYVECRMKSYEFLNKRTVVDYLQRWLPFPGLQGSVPPPPATNASHSVDASTDADDIILPGDEDIRRLAAYRAEVDLLLFSRSMFNGCIFDYGHQRLGGMFLVFDELHETIFMNYSFVRCDVKRSGFTMRVLAAMIKERDFSRRFKYVRCVIPNFLGRFLAPLSTATKVHEMHDVSSMYGFDSGTLTQYTWEILSLLSFV